MTAKNAPYDAAKRTLDVVVASLLLILTLPIQLVIAVLVAVKLGRPVLFRQLRPGRHGEPFTLIKFRSMKLINKEKGLVSDKDRITTFSKKLRATSLDELPTLWNVLRGEMSMVGPRPLLVEYLPRYTAEQARRHEVRPGVTGLAQVQGRNRITWEERLSVDVNYVDQRCFRLDLRILWATLAVVFRQQGISNQDHVTMPRFGEDHDN